MRASTSRTGTGHSSTAWRPLNPTGKNSLMDPMLWYLSNTKECVLQELSRGLWVDAYSVPSSKI